MSQPYSKKHCGSLLRSARMADTRKNSPALMSKKAKSKKQPLKARPVSSRSPDELKKLARDIRANLVFCSGFIPHPNPSLLSSVFMPLVFGALKGTDLKTVGMLYEYYSKAGPLCVNGMPMFFSFYTLNKRDTSTVEKYLAKLRQAEEAALA